MNFTLAQFYLKRDRPWAARKRLEPSSQLFPILSRRRAAIALIQTYQKLVAVKRDDIEQVPNGVELAKKLAQKLVKRFPNSAEALKETVRLLK